MYPRNRLRRPKPNNAASDQTNRIRLQNGKENGRKIITVWAKKLSLSVCWPSVRNDLLPNFMALSPRVKYIQKVVSISKVCQVQATLSVRGGLRES